MEVELHAEIAEPCQVVTDISGTITDANPAAGDLLNVAARRLRGRPFALFFQRERRQISLAIEYAGRGHVERLNATLHPRERRSILVHVAADPMVPVGRNIRWTLTRVIDEAGARNP